MTRLCPQGHQMTPGNTRSSECKDGRTRHYCRKCTPIKFTALRTDLPEWRDDEAWLPIPGWEGRYSASEHGRIRSESRIVIGKGGRRIRYQGRLITQILRKDGRLEVTLREAGADRTRPVKRQVHRLILETFVGPRPEGMQCCHWDDVPTNNRLENLRWGTPQENSDDKVRNALRKASIEDLLAEIVRRESELEDVA